MIERAEWESIFRAIERMTAHHAVSVAEVIDRDPTERTIVCKETGGEPIPIVAQDAQFTAYKSGVKSDVSTVPALPQIGDFVLLAHSGGFHTVGPHAHYCIGVVQDGKQWEQPNKSEVVIPAQADVAAAVAAAMQTMWPVGSIFIGVTSTNPATLFGFGTWTAFGTGRTLVGIDAGQTEFDTVEEIGGEKAHTLTGAESGIATHTHTFTGDTMDTHGHSHQHGNYSAGGTGTRVRSRVNTAVSAGAVSMVMIGGAEGTVDTDVDNTQTSAGTPAGTNSDAGPSDAANAHNNLQPYTVVYMWKRTA